MEMKPPTGKMKYPQPTHDPKTLKDIAYIKNCVLDALSDVTRTTKAHRNHIDLTYPQQKHRQIFNSIKKAIENCDDKNIITPKKLHLGYHRTLDRRLVSKDGKKARLLIAWNTLSSDNKMLCHGRSLRGRPNDGRTGLVPEWWKENDHAQAKLFGAGVSHTYFNPRKCKLLNKAHPEIPVPTDEMFNEALSFLHDHVVGQYASVETLRHGEAIVMFGLVHGGNGNKMPEHWLPLLKRKGKTILSGGWENSQNNHILVFIITNHGAFEFLVRKGYRMDKNHKELASQSYVSFAVLPNIDILGNYETTSVWNDDPVEAYESKARFLDHVLNYLKKKRKPLQSEPTGFGCNLGSKKADAKAKKEPKK